jgi:hypothetical protein
VHVAHYHPCSQCTLSPALGSRHTTLSTVTYYHQTVHLSVVPVQLLSKSQAVAWRLVHTLNRSGFR